MACRGKSRLSLLTQQPDAASVGPLRSLLRVAAEAQRLADQLGPAAESALGAADAAVKAARLAAVKLRAQVRACNLQLSCAVRSDAERQDAHRSKQKFTMEQVF